MTGADETTSPRRSDLSNDGDGDLRPLMARVAGGDRHAFAELYDALSPMVYGLTLRVLRNPAIAEEATQEIFVELWRTAPRFDESKGSVQGWTATIAHRRSVDRVRSEEAARRRDNAEATGAELTAPGADEHAESNLESARVRRALDELPAPQRESIELAYFGGHTYREVARVLGLAEGTVKTRIRDGLLRLRRELGAGR